MGCGNAVKFTGIVAQIPEANIKEFLVTITMEAERAVHLRGQVKVEKDGVLHTNPCLNLNLLRGDEPRSTLPILPNRLSFLEERLQAFRGIFGLHQLL